MEVSYCRGCGTKLGSEDAGHPDLLRTEHGNWCPNCTTGLVGCLPSEQQEIVIKKTFERSLEEAPVRNRKDIPRTTRRRRLPARRKPVTIVPIVIAVIVLLGALVLLLGR